jgi:hypothetical protein
VLLQLVLLGACCALLTLLSPAPLFAHHHQ